MTGRPTDILKVYQTLEELYLNTECFLNFDKDYELLFAVILSAQSTDKAVNEATSLLFKRFPTLASYTFERRDEIISCIKKVGLSTSKSKYLIEAAFKLLDEYEGRVPSSRDELMKFNGVGYKTSGVVLGELFNYPLIPVDTHVFRVSHRLGIVKDDLNPEQTEVALEKAFKDKSSIVLHRRLILFGRNICKASSPSCEVCPLASECKYRTKLLKKQKNV